MDPTSTPDSDQNRSTQSHTPKSFLDIVLPRLQRAKEFFFPILPADISSNFLHSSQEIVANFSSSLISHTENRSWYEVELILDFLLKQESGIDRQHTIGIVNSKLNSADGMHIIHGVIVYNAPISVLIKLLYLGANANALTDDLNTPLHLAVSKIKTSWDRDSESSILGRVNTLLKYHADPNTVNLAGISCFNESVLSGLSVDQIKPVLTISKKLAEYGGSSDQFDGTEPVDIINILSEIESGFSTFLDTDKEAIKQLVIDRNVIFSNHFSLKDIHSYALLIRDPEDPSFIELAPRMLLFYPESSILSVISNIEAMMDNAEPARNFLASEAELLLLLNSNDESPKLSDTPYLDSLTSAITSISRFIEVVTEPVIPITVWSWAQIGSLGHSFTRWKYDAMALRNKLSDGTSITLAPSLLEHYGFEFVEKRSDDPSKDVSTRKIYGSGFILRHGTKNFIYEAPFTGEICRYNSKTLIEFRRAYLLVSNPEHGTLIIRNSSPLFGRDAFKHPAYWSPRGIENGFTESDILGLDDQLVAETFAHILDREVNQQGKGLREGLTFLLNELCGVIYDYGKWKWDTGIDTAWQTLPDLGAGEESILIGGNKSPGFHHVVNLLERISENRDPGAPQLALGFFNTALPPWIPFGDPESNMLKITPRILKSLQRLVEGTNSLEELERNGIYKFFQTGFDFQGELVIISADDFEGLTVS